MRISNEGLKRDPVAQCVREEFIGPWDQFPSGVAGLVGVPKGRSSCPRRVGLRPDR